MYTNKETGFAIVLTIITVIFNSTYTNIWKRDDIIKNFNEVVTEILAEQLK